MGKQKAEMKTRLTILLFGLTLMGALAELSTVVTPGYTFSAGERLTLEKLNLLGRPVVFVTGTVDGSNALSAGSVFPVHLNSAVAGSNLVLTASGLVLANQGAGANQLSTNAFGLGLTGGAGTPVRTVVDTNTITWTGNALTVGTGLSNVNVSANAAIDVSKLAWASNTVIGGHAAGTNTHLTVTAPLAISGTSLVWQSYSNQTATGLGTGLVLNAAHGLPGAPQCVQAFVVCATADLDYAVGDILPATLVQDDAERPAIIYGGNSTNVFVTVRSGNWRIQNKGSADNINNMTKASWSIRVLAY